MKAIFSMLLAFAVFAGTSAQAQTNMDQTIYQFDMDLITGESQPLKAYEGKVVLIVNVASECGLTPQYEDLQQLYDTYKEQGLVVLGFPANNFGAQEPGTDAEIQSFCTSRFGVTFPMFSKISVKGNDQHALYRFLTNESENGVMDSNVKWNFQKYLVGRDGKLIDMIPPMKKVDDPSVIEQIETALQ